MNSRPFGVAWYHLRATLHRDWGGYLALILLVGLVGGVAMGAIAGARRTQSAFPNYLARSHASNLQFQLYSSQPLAAHFVNLVTKYFPEKAPTGGPVLANPIDRGRCGQAGRGKPNFAR